MGHSGRPNHSSCQGVELGLVPSGPFPLFSQGRKAGVPVSTSPRPCQLLPGRQAWGNRELLSFSSTIETSTNISFPEGHVRTCELMPGPGSKARCSANAVSWEGDWAAFLAWPRQFSREFGTCKTPLSCEGAKGVSLLPTS